MKKRFVCWLMGHTTDNPVGEPSKFFPRLRQYRCNRCDRLFWQYGNISVQIMDDDPRLKYED